jgi:hypothetical protein
LFQYRILKRFSWAGKAILASCPYLFVNSVAIANCIIPEIPKKIDNYIKENTYLQSKKKSGRWIALDKIISARDLEATYECLSDKMLKIYQKEQLEVPQKYRTWKRVNDVSFYAPANDFGWVNVFVNREADKYSLNKYTSEFKEGSIIVKEGYTFDISGRSDIGPLFYMEKMKQGYNEESNDWKFTEVNVDGTYAEMGGHDSELTKRCVKCHTRRKDSDFLFFLKK